ncbi:PD-(D/E)XK motif protein [Stenoxybacter acetivorans]|uniref:PD-(D/E)XK motif protein n=1 Tax=Stenoxybacter acetivorans TaxID=422441 RepID=UPI000566A7BD|nr:PD-(D/E)XK motif protein [Stenoxybacter acetivorans]
MKLNAAELEAKWQTIKSEAFVLIQEKSAWHWHIGQTQGRRVLLWIGKTAIHNLKSSQAIDVRCGLRENGEYALNFELSQSAQNSVFAAFCADIIQHTTDALDETDAIERLRQRYKQWSRLLQTKRGGLLNAQNQKGLFGELLFLEQQLNQRDGLLATVQGWVGIEDAPQDFIYADIWYEIKSIASVADTVMISSLAQLSAAGAGRLVVQRIDKAAPKQVNTYSLNELVQRLEKVLAKDMDAFNAFEQKLFNYGYLNLADYDEQKYQWQNTQVYAVDEHFPRINTAVLPTAVVGLRYELAIAALQDWLQESTRS